MTEPLSLVLIDFDVSLDVAGVLVLFIAIFDSIRDCLPQGPLAAYVLLDIVRCSGWDLFPQL